LNWMALGIIAGIVLGFYDYWTKKAMVNNNAVDVTFLSAFVGALLWIPAFLNLQLFSPLEFANTSAQEQLLIFVKSIAMSFSWLFAYYAVRELPMSFSGAVRASGPIWTFLGGIFFFGELLSISQLIAVGVSILVYYLFSIVGKNEGIVVLKSRPMAMMLVATLLSAMTTVYDKHLLKIFSGNLTQIQAYSALQRAIICFAIFFYLRRGSISGILKTINPYVVLVGASWIAAEWIYFFALSDPNSNLTYFSVFRRFSLVVGFILSIFLIGETQVFRKSILIGFLLASSIYLIVIH